LQRPVPVGGSLQRRTESTASPKPSSSARVAATSPGVAAARSSGFSSPTLIRGGRAGASSPSSIQAPQQQQQRSASSQRAESTASPKPSLRARVGALSPSVAAARSSGFGSPTLIRADRAGASSSSSSTLGPALQPEQGPQEVQLAAAAAASNLKTVHTRIYVSPLPVHPRLQTTNSSPIVRPRPHSPAVAPRLSPSARSSDSTVPSVGIKAQKLTAGTLLTPGKTLTKSPGHGQPLDLASSAGKGDRSKPHSKLTPYASESRVATRAQSPESTARSSKPAQGYDSPKGALELTQKPGGASPSPKRLSSPPSPLSPNASSAARRALVPGVCTCLLPYPLYGPCCSPTYAC
jgi:hypothetical protein